MVIKKPYMFIAAKNLIIYLISNFYYLFIVNLSRFCTKYTIHYSESINILHQIYDSLICFNSVKGQQIDYNLL